MNVIDSSVWLDYSADGPNAASFAKAIEDLALQVVAQMKLGQLVVLDEDLAIEAARLSVTHKIPMADSLILVTTRAHDAWIWTQDDDFKNLAKVNYRTKK